MNENSGTSSSVNSVVEWGRAGTMTESAGLEWSTPAKQGPKAKGETGVLIKVLCSFDIAVVRKQPCAPRLPGPLDPAIEVTSGDGELTR